jgi:hypothetical protein
LFPSFVFIAKFLINERPRSNFDEISTQLDKAEILLKEALNTIKQTKNKTNRVYIQTEGWKSVFILTWILNFHLNKTHFNLSVSVNCQLFLSWVMIKIPVSGTGNSTILFCYV